MYTVRTRMIHVYTYTSLSLSIYIYIYIYVHAHTLYTYIYIYIYTHVEAATDQATDLIYHIRLQYTLVYCSPLYYTIIYYRIILCYNALHYTMPYYTILYYTILYYTILYYTMTYYTILYYTILYYTILYYIIRQYNLRYSGPSGHAHRAEPDDKPPGRHGEEASIHIYIYMYICISSYSMLYYICQRRGPRLLIVQYVMLCYSIYICIYICVYIYIYIHVYMYTSLSIYTYIYIYIYMYIHIHTYTYTYMCTHICIYTHVCVCIYIYIYTHTYMHTLCIHSRRPRSGPAFVASRAVCAWSVSLSLSLSTKIWHLFPQPLVSLFPRGEISQNGKTHKESPCKILVETILVEELAVACDVLLRLRLRWVRRAYVAYMCCVARSR